MSIDLIRSSLSYFILACFFIFGVLLTAAYLFFEYTSNRHQIIQEGVNENMLLGNLLSVEMEYALRGSGMPASRVITVANTDRSIISAVFIDQSDKIILANQFSLKNKHVSDTYLGAYSSVVKEVSQGLYAKTRIDYGNYHVISFFPIALEPKKDELFSSKAGVLILIRDQQPEIQRLYIRLANQAVIAVLIIILFIWALWVIVNRVIINRIQRLSAAANRIEEIEEDAEIFLLAGQDELSQLGSSLNKMCFDLRNSKAKQKTAEHRLQLLYDETPTQLTTLDKSLKIRSVNKYGASCLGYKLDQLVNKPIEVIYPTDVHDIVRLNLSKIYASTKEEHNWETKRLKANAQTIWVRESARLINLEKDDPVILLASEDITLSKELQTQLEYQATHDPLTGLDNRRAFWDQLSSSIKAGSRHNKHAFLCYIDLDQFKVINDTSGHYAGDELLIKLAMLINEHKIGDDCVARLGGDEFAILMYRENQAEALASANKLLDECKRQRFVWNEKLFSISVSIGLVPVLGGHSTPKTLLMQADTACYAAKQAGRGRVQLHSEEDENLASMRTEIEWVSRINLGLEKNHFQLYAQIIDSTKGNNQYLHYEILVRLDVGTNELILPGAFLPAAEHYGIAPILDRWIIKNTLFTLRNAPDHLNRLDNCSINLSGESINDQTFSDELEQLIVYSRVPPTKLCFEITETAAIANLQSARIFMNRFKKMGCRFALDDFGSGLSSFGHLKTLPVDYVKIDGYFVRHITTNEVDYAMVKAIKEVSSVMKIKTIAEFVEDDQIRAKLLEIGVDFVQGYGIARPVPLEDLLS